MADRAPFTTDGCSGGMSWIWRRVLRRRPPWEHACVSHDLAYWRGGSAADRRHADAMLAARVCMNGHPVWAFTMWLAVRIGGHPLLPTPWRWGYGFPYPTSYRK
ncbi:hypothetical protein [Chitinimonas koreensis]|uniref:hypothetical protein n=1 Tax=Chitinimonas koreensis TaxID=356302 RepID=UPI000687DB36|nr:hypothetical protein [Chitinimonas koreensis]QNM94931.1 hypothetical protein H9L41_13475 [Chitinimonas koreensis]